MKSSRLVWAAIALFAAQAATSRILHRDPFLPAPPALANIPLELEGWTQVAEETVSPETLDTLGPDDFLARLYQAPGATEPAEVFVAYYKSQLRSKNAHDPKVCLPGAGWDPVESRLAYVTEPGSRRSFPVNYYRIKKNDSDEVVFYWFQTAKGVYTFEQQLRAHRVIDAIIDNRTDMALVRIIVPVTSQGVASADANAARLSRAIHTEMLRYFPAAERSGS